LLISTNIGYITSLDTEIGIYNGLFHSITQNFNPYLLSIVPILSYSNADTMKTEILNENRNKIGIYRWINLLNGKSYVGSGVNLSHRLKLYYSLRSMNAQLKRGKSAIYSSILKHGHSSFSLEILEYCEPDNVVTREQHYLDLLKPEYNLLGTAGSSLGYLHSVGSIAKMSEAKKGNKNRIGKSHSELAKAKMSEVHIGKILSDKTKAKMSEIKKGKKNPLFGKTHSEETKNKMSEGLGTAVKVLDLETNGHLPFLLSVKQQSQ